MPKEGGEEGSKLADNLSFLLSEMGWSYAHLAQLMYPTETKHDQNLVDARSRMSRVIKKRQARWDRHMPALARALAIDEAALMNDSLREICGDAAGLETHYGLTNETAWSRAEKLRAQRALPDLLTPFENFVAGFRKVRQKNEPEE